MFFKKDLFKNVYLNIFFRKIIIIYGNFLSSLYSFDVLKHIFRGVGYALLAYKTSFILSQNPEAKNSLL